MEPTMLIYANVIFMLSHDLVDNLAVLANGQRRLTTLGICYTILIRTCITRTSFGVVRG